jgi:hypothetical protein
MKAKFLALTPVSGSEENQKACDPTVKLAFSEISGHQCKITSQANTIIVLDANNQPVVAIDGNLASKYTPTFEIPATYVGRTEFDGFPCSPSVPTWPCPSGQTASTRLINGVQVCMCG